MAITRVEFNALAARVAALEGKTSTGTPTPVIPKPVITKPVVTVISLSTPTVKLTGSSYVVTASLQVTKATAFTYLQLAVRGPGATDLALSPGTSLAAGASKTLTGSARGQAGAYTAYLAYSIDGKTWVDGPKASFTVAAEAHTTTPAGEEVGLKGKSGLPFNSVVFRSYPREAEEFGRRRGTPVDGLLTFSSRQSWGDFRWVPDGTADYLNSGHLVINSMPHAPESEGSAMNERGANDAYKDEQRALGKHLKDSGLNTADYVVRVDWECNGDWYAWSANRSGGHEALRASIKNYIVNLRAGGATKVRFDLCFNKGPSQSGHDFDIFPGAEFVDVIGIDQYDMWSPSYTPADWEQEMTAKSPTIRGAADFAKKHGILWSWDEGGNTHGDANQGGDNPRYWEFVRAEIQRNIDNCAWHNTYDHEGAPASLAHDFNQNPKSWPVYKKLWTPQ